MGLGALALLVAVAGSSSARTVAEVVSRYGPAAERRLKPFFEKAKVDYPPKAIALLGFKEEMRLEVWAKRDGTSVFVRSYPIRQGSGAAGPKLRQGDLQVPEGLYGIAGLNPNSSYHLSMKINYPNEFDRRQAVREGRRRLGGDIFIHGKAVSIGCLAMGDSAIEELFVLASRVGKENISVVLAPRDFRERPPSGGATSPAWVAELYRAIQTELVRYSSKQP